MSGEVCSSFLIKRMTKKRFESEASSIRNQLPSDPRPRMRVSNLCNERSISGFCSRSWSTRPSMSLKPIISWNSEDWTNCSTIELEGTTIVLLVDDSMTSDTRGVFEETGLFGAAIDSRLSVTTRF
uniref:Uncharacterized protein n=1 Tax=Cacopsylla melanoneura TaxID=428564 RepID=A0A8D9FFU2_9HEMI